MKKDIKVASNLLDIEAVKLSPSKPFTWASGWKSPIYCDNRKLLSYPEKRKEICEYIKGTIEKYFPNCEIIAGVATGAIAYGSIVADMMNKPFIYIRSSEKDHGLKNRVEGVLPKAGKVVLIEDLISSGGSSLSALDAVEKEGGMVLGMVAIFSYNFGSSRRAFEKKNIILHTLSNYDALIDVALEKGIIKEKDVNILKKWRLSPETWGQNEE
ncbi:MAG: orotate phosphoribosyltransferase [Bacteroidales bacterium]